MKGIVYRAHCLITNKDYIGLTTRTLDRRRKEHLYAAFKKMEELHFSRALRKYGVSAFEWSVLTTVSAKYREDLIESLKALEKKYIKQFDSYHNGYNSTPGGDSINIQPLKVKVYSETGEFIRQFDSRREAAQYYSISEDCVSAGCTRRQKFSLVLGKRLLFRNEEDTVTESDLSELKQTIHNPKCKVKAFDYTTGEEIKTFDTIKEGADFFGLKSATPICEILNGSSRRKTAGKYKGSKVGWTKVDS